MAAKNDKATDKATAPKRFTIAAPKANKEGGVKLVIRSMPVSMLGAKISEGLKQVAEETKTQPEIVRGTLTVYCKKGD